MKKWICGVCGGGIDAKPDSEDYVYCACGRSGVNGPASWWGWVRTIGPVRLVNKDSVAITHWCMRESDTDAMTTLITDFTRNEYA